jgi:outer membrane protein assembly factor BamB
MEWPPAAYSPRTQFIYTHYIYGPNIPGTNNDAATNTFCPTGIDGTVKVATCGRISGGTALGVHQGVYGAINTQTGKIAWTVPTLTTAPGSGMTIAGDLVFFGDSTGLFYAASAATGQILWVFDSWTVPNAPGANASAAIYEIGGVEYVVYGFGGEPGKSFELGDAVIAFALPSALAAAKAGAATAQKALAQRGRVR